MDAPLLATKLHIPPLRPKVVSRKNLVERLNEGRHCKLTLVSAPAGFGKTTLVSEWAASCGQPVAWLSLDAGDNDTSSFLSYLVASLQTVAPKIGEQGAASLQSPQPPPTESILTALLNEIATILDNFVLVLDDYHLIDAKPVDDALTFLLERLPPQMHLVIATREDPNLPLARLRARGELTEVRAADLRFTVAEAAQFLNDVMGLNLLAEDVAALETRTEGWIAGLQLAAISMQGHGDAAGFIKSFTGSHRFVLDYLIEEVLRQQAESIQSFLLRTSILDRLCGPLCDGLLGSPSGSGQETLEYLEHANLFIVPLDNERRWYRYHHLFAELLRQRLKHGVVASTGDQGNAITELHRRASQWYEDNGLELEAFQQAAAAGDVARAERLIEGKGMPLHFRGGAVPVLNWLESLPAAAMDARPSLWTAYASTLLVTGQATRVEQKLQAAEAALQGAEPDEKTRDLIGRIAAIRATLAINQNRVEAIVAQSRRALEYLRPDNLAFRTSTAWKLGYAYQLQGNRAAAIQAYAEVISIGEASGNVIFTIAATIGSGSLQEGENQLYLAAESYRRALKLFGDQPLPLAAQAHLGLARILYEWNELDAARQHAQQSLQLSRPIENNASFIGSQVLLARLKLARGEVDEAATLLAEAERSARQQDRSMRLKEIAAAQVAVLIRQEKFASAAELATQYDLPLSQARALIAQGNPSAALEVLEPFRQQMETRGWADERLKTIVVQAVALHASGEEDQATQLLGHALARAQPGGLIRIFVDEGTLMSDLLSHATAQGMMPDYVSRLLAAFETHEQPGVGRRAVPRKDEDNPRLSPTNAAQPLIEPLSQRELDILQLIAQGLSNRQIGERLFLALSTVKGHNRNIFDKLQVQSRTEALARARELGLLQS